MSLSWSLLQAVRVNMRLEQRSCPRLTRGRTTMTSSGAARQLTRKCLSEALAQLTSILFSSSTFAARTPEEPKTLLKAS